MTKTVEFHFDFGSPNAYLSHAVIPGIEQRTGATFNYVPVLLGGVFKATNNVSPAISMQGILNKGEYQRVETQRFVARYGIENYAANPHFPVNTLLVMRGAIAAQKLDIFKAYVDAVYEHMWIQPKKMDDPDIVWAALSESGMPVDELKAGAVDPDVKAQLIQNTQASVERGNFGSPTFFLDDEMYFGKNTLPELEEALLR
ncbi:MAG: 2-hydroxychromene-2-carboxylate isomerase [Pseudomonadaceae bacterium]|nr:2-hydroxychromene-2-carboxylate isomerase [Pseudomonadaceae bacterium]